MEPRALLHRVQKLLRENRTGDAVHEIEQLAPADQADLIEELSESDRRQIEPRLATEELAHILEEMEDFDAAEFAEGIDPVRLAKVIDTMELDDAADILGDFDAALREQMLANMEDPADVQQLLAYPDDSAGGRMKTRLMTYAPETETQQVWAGIRRSKDLGNVVPYVFVVDQQRKLLGIIGPLDLIKAMPADRLDGYMQREVLSVNPHDPQEVAARMMSRHDLAALPVVDGDQRLVGAITFDDAMEALEEEETQDILNKGAVSTLGSRELARSHILVRGPIWTTLRVRLPFLVITLVGGLLAGVVIDAFEEAVRTVTALAVFIPVVMDMGGNSGTQSSTIFVRGLSLGQINTSRFGRVLLREITVGFSMGAALGLAGGLIATLWQQVPGVGLVVGFSLLFTMTLATMLGFLVPFLLHRLGFDAAAGSDPIITTIKDISGLLIYFGLAYLFMGII